MRCLVFRMARLGPGLDGGALPYPGIAVAMGQELAQKTPQQQAIAASDQTVDVKDKTRGAQRQGIQVAMRPEGIRPAPTNKPSSPQSSVAPRALPFGLAAERVSEGEILHKGTDVQSEIRDDKETGPLPERKLRTLSGRE